MAMTKAKKRKIITLIICGIVILLLIFYAVMGELSRRYILRNHLDNVMVTIDGEGITLQEMAYYVIDVEDTINRMAIDYNPDKPEEFWNTHFSNSLDSVFTRDYAKKLVRELYIYDYVMEKEAIKKGYSLTLGEKNGAREDAGIFYDNLSEHTIKVLEVDEEQIVMIFERKMLVEKYVKKFADILESEGYTGDIASQLNFDGLFYQDKIKSEYDISFSELEFNRLPLGTITINYE